MEQAISMVMDELAADTDNGEVFAQPVDSDFLHNNDSNCFDQWFWH